MKENAKTGEISDIIRNSNCSISNTENLRKYNLETNKPGPRFLNLRAIIFI